jgi:hypothetical protein
LEVPVRIITQGEAESKEEAKNAKESTVKAENNNTDNGLVEKQKTLNEIK